MRNFKTMGLALVAILAMSALGAATAQAEKPAKFTAGAGTTKLDVSAEGKQKFNLTGLAVECEVLDGHAAFSGATTELTGTGVGFTNCNTVILGFINLPQTTVEPSSGCHFGFAAGTWIGASSDATGSVEICEITVTQYKDKAHTEIYCREHVTAQKVGGLTYTNKEENGKATVTVDVNSGATVQTVKTNTGTTGCNKQEEVNATYTGNFWVTGTNEAGEQTTTSVSS